MICTYMRSSSFSNYNFCEQQYFLNYVLGIPRSVGKKADMGTATHKVLEILACIKKYFQDNESDVCIYKDEITNVTVYIDDFLKPTKLTSEQVERVNQSRVNKQVYKTPVKLDYGHTRYGVELVETLINDVSSYYKSKSDESWQPIDLKHVTNWVWMALDFNKGTFDPRRRTIVAPETHFDIELPYEWASYLYDVDGPQLKGQLRLKGTIDLLTDIGSETLEIVDWKTGQRLDWATGKEKTYKSLCEDFQLLLYHYACNHLFPDAKQVMVTIFFIRDGGPYTICFENRHLSKTEDMIREQFLKIKKNARPRMVDPLQNSFKCNKICDYYKQKSPDGETNFCKFIHDEIRRTSIDAVTSMYKNPNFDFGTYEAPGE